MEWKMKHLCCLMNLQYKTFFIKCIKHFMSVTYNIVPLYRMSNIVTDQSLMIIRLLVRFCAHTIISRIFLQTSQSLNENYLGNFEILYLHGYASKSYDDNLPIVNLQQDNSPPIKNMVASRLFYHQHNQNTCIGTFKWTIVTLIMQKIANGCPCDFDL